MLKANEVYVLLHRYNWGEDNEFSETKFIGVYSSKENAEETIKRLIDVEGFNRYPVSCFIIDTYTLDEDNWAEGFISFEDFDEEISSEEL